MHSCAGWVSSHQALARRAENKPGEFIYIIIPITAGESEPLALEVTVTAVVKKKRIYAYVLIM